MGGRDDGGVVERRRRRRGDRVPRGVVGNGGVGVARYEPQERGGDGTRAGTRSGRENTPICSTCATSRTSTFSASCRSTEASTSSSAPSLPAGERPAALIRRPRTPPGEHGQRAVADLQHRGEHLVLGLPIPAIIGSLPG